MRGSVSLSSFTPFELRRFRVLAVVWILSFVALSCSRTDSNQREEDRLERAYALIDSGREQEAIELLQASLRDTGMNSSREEALKAALASAYVKRAGLPAQSFYAFARTWIDAEDDENFSFSRRNNDRESASALRNAPKSAPKNALETFEAHGLEALAFFLQVKTRFDQLPELSADQDGELKEALSVLSTLQAPSRGVALYRGLISTVRFKHRLKNGLYFSQPPGPQGAEEAPLRPNGRPNENADPLACVRGKIGFFSGLEALSTDVESILGDLMIAFPNQNASMADAKKGVAHAKEGLARLKTETLPGATLGGYEWGEVVRFVRLQFGWEWSCE